MKIRALHPEFFTDTGVAALSFPARLLFAGLWCHSDDYGRGRWLPKSIEGAIFPRDPVDIEALLGDLVDAGMVVRYQVAQDFFYFLPNWEKYQTPKYRAKTSVPEPDTPVTTALGNSETSRGQSSPELSRQVLVLEEVLEEEEVLEVVKRLPAKRSDPLFAALVEATTGTPYQHGQELTDRERGILNQAAGQLRRVKGEPSEVIRRAGHFVMWMGQLPTPGNLLTHWNRLSKPQQRASPEQMRRLQQEMDRQARDRELEATR